MITEKEINRMIKAAVGHGWCKSGDVSDGHHTFGELYDHRNLLFIWLCRTLHETKNLTYQIWRKPVEDGWFLMGIGFDAGKQITYHLPEHLWQHTNFLSDVDAADYKFDGHTSREVIKRLMKEINA